MLAELARNGTIARPDDLLDAHRRAVAALETLGRHGYRSAVLPRWLRPKPVFRFFVAAVARYVVVSHLRRVLPTCATSTGCGRCRRRPIRRNGSC